MTQTNCSIQVNLQTYSIQTSHTNTYTHKIPTGHIIRFLLKYNIHLYILRK